MAGIIGNFVFAYGFVTDISNKRYFEGATINSDMETVKAKKRWRRFLNEVGWYHSFFGIGIEEQTKLYVFGERILSGEDDTLIYLDYAYTGPDEVIIHDIQEDIFDAELTYRDIIDHEAALNGTTPSFLFFMNDKDYAAMEVYGGMPPRPDWEK